MSTKGIAPDIVFRALLATHGIQEPTTEHRFHAVRKWRFDYAWPRWKVALEVEGGIFGFTDPKTGQRRYGGAHGSIAGIKRDIEKYNHAAAMGWLVIRCLPTTLCTGETIAYIKESLKRQGCEINKPF